MKRVGREPAVRLALLASASLAIYALALVRPYGLLEWWRSPLKTIAKMANADPQAAASYLTAFTALFALYLMAACTARGDHGVWAWIVVLAGAGLFSLVLVWLYPVDAADVFDNIVRGRILAQYGANPFYETPDRFPRDPFFRYAAWRHFSSAYGPLWEATAAGASRLAEWLGGKHPVIVHVLVFKLMSIVAYAGTVVLTGLILRRAAPERALYGTLLSAWNPLVVYTAAGTGHNDAVMVFFLVLGFYWLGQGRFTLAVLAHTAGALVKFVPVLLLPVVLVYAMRRLEGWRARGRYLLVTGSACTLMAAGFYAPFWQSGDILGLAWRGTLFTTSLPAVLKVALTPGLGEPTARSLAGGAALLAMAGWIAWQMRTVWRGQEPLAAVRAGWSILMFYLLVSCLWFQPWYATWPLALAALLPAGPEQAGSLLFSYAVLWKMPVFDFVLVGRGGLPPRAWREWRITLATLGVVWAYWAIQGGRTWVAAVRRWRVDSTDGAVPAHKADLSGRPACTTTGAGPAAVGRQTGE